MIQVRYNRGEHSLQVTGHSGAAPAGQDLICAGVSALLCTMGEATDRLRARGMLEDACIRLENGLGEVFCRPVEGFTCVVLAVMDSFVLGLELLAEAYPDHVAFHRER